MTNSRPALRVTKVVVEHLNNRYDHAFDLDQNDRVTIIHGPNGVGKTVLLRMIYAVFSGRFFDLLKVPFRNLRLEFGSDGFLSISRDIGEGIEGERVVVERVGDQLVPTRVEFVIDEKVLARYATSIARMFPWMARMDEGRWLDRRTGQRMSTLEVLTSVDVSKESRSRAPNFSEKLKPLAEAQEILSDIASRISVHIIEAQRLLKVNMSDAAKGNAFDDEDEDVEVRSSVDDCAEEIKRRLSRTLAIYATESQKSDQTFPQRLLQFGPMPLIDSAKLKSDLESIERKRASLAEIGLLVEQKGAAGTEPLNPEQLKNINDIQKNVMALYAEDTAKKLDILDQVASSVRILLDVLNKKFRNKRLLLDNERGLVAKTDEDAIIKLDGLSSGEQHQLVLFFDLLFKVKKDALVLIDEPELSLHVTWQKSFLTELLTIVKANGFDVLVATHSPYIVSDRSDLLRELNSGDYRDDDFELKDS